MNSKRLYLILLWSVTSVCILIGVVRYILPYELSFFSFGRKDGVSSEDAPNEVTEQVTLNAFTTLHAEVSVSDVTVRAGREYALKITPKKAGSTRNAPTYGMDGDTLTVRQDSTRRFGIFSLGTGKTDAYDIEITLPANETLDKIRIDTGTGKVTLKDIAAKELRVDSGTGKVECSGCTGDDVHIDTGTGKVAVDLAEAAKSVKIDSGTGKVELNLPGEAKDYAFKIDAGTGGINLDGTSYRHEYTSTGDDAAGVVDIDAGTGKITVTFD